MSHLSSWSVSHREEESQIECMNLVDFLVPVISKPYHLLVCVTLCHFINSINHQSKRSLDRRIPHNVKDELQMFFYRRRGPNRRQGNLPMQKRHKIGKQKRPHWRQRQQQRQQQRRNQEAQQNHPIRLVQCHLRFTKSQGEMPVCRMSCI